MAIKVLSGENFMSLIYLLATFTTFFGSRLLLNNLTVPYLHPTNIHCYSYEFYTATTLPLAESSKSPVVGFRFIYTNLFYFFKKLKSSRLDAIIQLFLRLHNLIVASSLQV
jgi:hypothetical protein